MAEFLTLLNLIPQEDVMKKIVWAALAFVLIGCGGGGTAVKKGQDNGKDAMQAKFQKFMARETAGLQPTQSGGDLKISVLSKGKPKTAISNKEKPRQYDMTIPIGASLDMTCYITEEMSSPAVVLKALFDNILKLPGIESAGFKALEADIFKNVGYVYLEAEYLTKDKKYGTAKMVAASTVNVSFYCTHDELGYKKTFLKAADSLANSAYVQKFVKEFSGYDRKQIDIAFVNNMAVGYAESYQFPGEDKTSKNFSFSTFLIPRSATEIMSGDSVDTTVYDAGTGALVSGNYNSYENNEAEHEIEFEQVAATRYKAKGTLQGKNFDKTFDTDKALVYSGFIVDQYSAGKTGNKEWNFEEYVPQSPIKPTKSRIVLKEQMPNGSKKVEYTFHTLKALLEVDKKSYTTMNLDMGGITFVLKRKFIDAH